LERRLTEALHEPVIAPASCAEPPAMTGQRRQPPKAICLLVPVWGDDYVDQFLERSLPTLLAPGNIPALAKVLPTRIVFLSRARDATTIRAHRAHRQLHRVCKVEVLPIDDLIMQGNHSTTVTLAYARAVRQTGEAMLDTCFFFIVSDYIMADGSLSAVLARMQAGASAVQAGNFQLDTDVAEPWLQEQFDDAKMSVELTSRQLIRWALSCLHPLTAATIVNFPLCHNSNANRLFWHVDSDTLIGRFYLLHMICIRPEVIDFVIGSSCDYSFVPEMCPTGRVETITDSDEYLVVEVQPHGHESNFLRLGPGSVEVLAESLSEWTTAHHRANAQETIVFHASALPESLPPALAEADEFIQTLSRQLEPSPQPHRNHPYWLGAIAAFDEAIAQRESGMVKNSLPLIARAVGWLQSRFLGRVPEVRRTHPRWLDFETPVAAGRELTAGTTRLLIGSSRSTPMSEWFRYQAPDGVPVSLHRLMLGRSISGAEPGTFDAAFVELVDDYVTHMGEIVRLIAPLLRPSGQVFLLALNTSWPSQAEHTGGGAFAAGLASLVRSKPSPDDCHLVSASRLRWRVNGACIDAAAALFQRPTLSFPLHLAMAAVLLPIAVFTNIVSLRRIKPFAPGRIPTSFVRLQVNSVADSPAGGECDVRSPAPTRTSFDNLPA
jgi:hypothetical protein